MKKLIYLLLLSFFVLGLNNNTIAQKNKKQEYIAPEMPINNDTKLVSYTEVVETKATSEEIKKKALKWFHSYYKNSSNLLKKNTETEFVGHPRFKVLNPKDKKGIATMAGTIIYDIKLSFKDGKYRYQITNIFKKASTKYPIEKWMDTESKIYNNTYAYYLTQTDEYMKAVIKSLKEYMAKADEKKNDDW